MEQTFRKWFDNNEGLLFDFERDRESICDKLSQEMKKDQPRSNL